MLRQLIYHLIHNFRNSFPEFLSIDARQFDGTPTPASPADGLHTSTSHYPHRARNRFACGTFFPPSLQSGCEYDCFSDYQNHVRHLTALENRIRLESNPWPIHN